MDFRVGRAAAVWLRQFSADFQLAVLARQAAAMQGGASSLHREFGRPEPEWAPQDYGNSTNLAAPMPAILLFAVMHRKGNAQQIRLVNKR